MKKQTIIKLISIIVLSIIVGILLLTINNKTNYLSFDLEIESITNVDNGISLTFIGDEAKEEDLKKTIKYIIYEKDVALEVLSDINIKDKVTIIVEDNYGENNYAIIYQMDYDGETLFNIMEGYEELGKNNKIVFISFFSSMILYLLILCVYKEKKRNNTIIDFVITNHSWEKYLFIGCVFGGLVFVFPFTILYLLKMCDIDYFMFSIVFYIFILLGVLGIYACLKEKFVLRDKTFAYHKVFGKTRSVKVSEISSILVIPNQIGNLVQIEFYNHKYNKVLWFLDDGRSFVDNLFVNACSRYNIPMKFVTKKISKTTLTKKYDVDKFIEYIKVLTKYDYEPEITITTKSKEKWLIVCYYDYIELQLKDKIIKTYIEEISQFINFDEELTIEGDLDFGKPLEGQIEIIDEKLWFIPKIR